MSQKKLESMQLNELKTHLRENMEVPPDSLSTTGKIFFAAVAAYLAGKVSSGAFLKLRGTPDELRAVADAIVASKAFQDELKKPDATIDSVIDKMNVKNTTAAKFQEITGNKWPI